MTDEQRQAVITLHGAGFEPNRIAQALNVGLDAVLRVVDPEYRKKRLENSRLQRIRMRGDRERYVRNDARESVLSHYRPSPELLKRLWAEVPPDTRSVTGALMGDPLKGRSALDRKLAAQRTF